MHTRAKKKYVASDRARRENVPRHILSYTAGDLAAIVWALSFQPSVLPWRHAVSFLESPVKVRKVVKTTLSGDRKDRIVGCTQTVSSYI